ncbi:hypothetical protein [Brasilonema sp. UFV-L1]|nr:hypothetical protein [Brasilonema sp. UFV-L1]
MIKQVGVSEHRYSPAQGSVLVRAIALCLPRRQWKRLKWIDDGS